MAAAGDADGSSADDDCSHWNFVDSIDRNSTMNSMGMTRNTHTRPEQLGQGIIRVSFDLALSTSGWAILLKCTQGRYTTVCFPMLSLS